MTECSLEQAPALEACSHQVRGSTAARHAFSSTSFHFFLPQWSSLLHQPYQTRLSRGIRCECLNVRRFKRGGEAAKHAPVYVARHWLTLLSSCLTLARGDEGAIFIIHGVSSASNRFILLLDSITCSFKLRVRNLLSSWQHVCTIVTPEPRAGWRERQRSGLPIFCVRRLTPDSALGG